MTPRLPIHAIEADLRAALERGPVVVSAATGSGKSTEVPRWVPRPVVVVEPRRVACRTLAARVAELEGSAVGDRVGYVVRDDAQPGADIVFVTPGIALRALERYLGFESFVLDELHERTLDVDLLLALARGRAKRLVVMSATIDADRVAAALGGEHLEASGRVYPVEIAHDDGGPTVPSPDGLASRVAKAVKGLAREDGDALVFLPGKGEIAQAKSALSGLKDRRVLELHGGLTPQAQAEVFRPGPPKVILSTNVAETSVTVPGVKAVIDAGLVRQVRYHQGRGALTLIPVARDSADQRAGRAGRTAPGRCLRLWRKNAHLEGHTPPEIHRVPLVSLVLAARAHGRDPAKLPWLDPPKPHALDAASEELRALGALTSDGELTRRGQALFRLPIDPWLGRVLVEAEQAGHLDDAIDLAAALELTRPLFSGDPDEDDPRKDHCDLLALVRAVRFGGAAVHRAARDEARQNRARLRRTFGLEDAPPADIDREGLLDVILRADPRAARVQRARGKRVAWGGEGTEVELDRRSAVHPRDPATRLPEAIVVLALRATREGTRSRLIATAAAGVSLKRLDDLGLGAPRVGAVKLDKGRVVTEVERVYAGRVLGTALTTPTGGLLREAVATLVERGRLFKGAFPETEARLEAARLARRLADANLVKTYPGDLDGLSEAEDARSFLLERLATLGLETEEELELLEVEDLLPPPLPPHVEAAIDRDYPRRFDLGEAKYRVRYDLAARRAVFILESGGRHTAPPRSYLPRLPGLKVSIQAGGTTVEI